MVRVLFVCLGNICRSPMAEAVFRHLVAEAGLSQAIVADSAGTGHWHVGEPPHRGTLRELQKHQVSADGLLARQVGPGDLREVDYLVAMDRENLADLRRLGAQKVLLLLELVPEEQRQDVPDPYYEGNFDEVYRLVEAGCRRLLARIRQEQSL